MSSGSVVDFAENSSQRRTGDSVRTLIRDAVDDFPLCDETDSAAVHQRRQWEMGADCAKRLHEEVHPKKCYAR